MAKTPSFSFLSILLILSFVIKKPNGLSIKLLHWDSPESPLYMENLTHLERIQRLVHQSKARAYRLSTDRASNGSHIADPKSVRAGLYGQETAVFMAEVGIGTFPAGRSSSFKSFYLHVDTASELVWTQCEDCKSPRHHCFSDNIPPYPNSLSRSYHPLVCGKHGLCYPNQCIDNSCAYQWRYSDGSFSVGILAYEIFFFDSGANRKQSIPLLFGCSIDSRDTSTDPKKSRLAGLLGLGWGPRSLVNQISSQSNWKFSYCLPPYSHGGKAQISFLRFGDDIRSTGQRLSTTPMLRYSNDQYYYLNLRGFTINEERLEIPARVFARSDDRVRCIIDSGSAISLIAKDTYASIRQAMVNYFSRYRGLKMKPGIDGFDLCYRRLLKTETIVYPTMTLHFQCADFVIKPHALFIEFQGPTFCLAMIAEKEETTLTTIGAFQQTNQLFIYDLKQKTLSFGPQDCSRYA